MDKAKDVMAMRHSKRAGPASPAPDVPPEGSALLSRDGLTRSPGSRARTGPWGILARLASPQGAQLYEFALALPILIVLTAGVLDFATAYNIKQKLTNAAREGARLGASQSPADITQTTPPSVGVIRDAVVTYLSNANINTSFVGSTMTPAGPFTWTYYSSGTRGLKIERMVPVPATDGGIILSTRVTITYPYNWTYGFDGIFGTGSTTITISTAAIMPNLG